jgi:hypothetical protein
MHQQKFRKKMKMPTEPKKNENKMKNEFDLQFGDKFK